MRKVLFTANTFTDEKIQELKNNGLEIISQRGDLSEDELIEVVKNVDAYIVGGDEIVTKKVIDSTDNLKIIAFLGTGYEHYVDVKAATAKGIVVTNTPRANAYTVAEHTVALILDVVKQITKLNNDTKQGGWHKHKTWNLKGKTLGIIGFGAIGSCVARIMHLGFDMKVIYFNRSPKPELEAELGAVKVTMPELLSQSDVVSIHVAYSDELHGLIGSKELELMKPTGVLINAARAEIVDPIALYQVLSNNQIAAAAFDVYYQEPPTKEEEGKLKLLSLSNDKFIITPHTAYNSTDAIVAMENMVIESLNDMFAGRKVNHQVN